MLAPGVLLKWRQARREERVVSLSRYTGAIIQSTVSAVFPRYAFSPIGPIGPIGPINKHAREASACLYRGLKTEDKCLTAAHE